MDPQDIMALDSDLKKYLETKSLQTTSSKEIAYMEKYSDSSYKSAERMLKIFKILEDTFDLEKIAIDKNPHRTELAANKQVGVVSAQKAIEILSNIYLSCPVGHRFKIKDSLDFGQAYTLQNFNSQLLKNKKFVSAALKISSESDKITGAEKIEELLKLRILGRSKDFPMYTKKMQYDQWKNVPEESRIAFISYGDTRNEYSKALLVVKDLPIAEGVESEEYVFIKSRSSYENAWEPDSGVKSYRGYRSLIFEIIGKKDIQRTGEDGKTIGIEETIAAKTDDSDEVDDFLDRSGLLYGPVMNLPGTEDLDEKYRRNVRYDPKWKWRRNLERVFDNKTKALADVIYKSLKLLDLFIKNATSDVMIDILSSKGKNLLPSLEQMVEQKVGQKTIQVPLGQILEASVESAINNIFKGTFEKPDAMQTYEDYIKPILFEVGETEKSKVLQWVYKQMNSGSDKFYEFATIAAEEVDEKEMNKIRELFNDKKRKEEGLDIMDLAFVKKIFSESFNKLLPKALPEKKTYKNVFGKNPMQISEEIAGELLKDSNFISYIIGIKTVVQTKEVKRRELITHRLVFISYARKMAQVFSRLYGIYFNSSNVETYVGFDLDTNLDLADPESIIGAARSGQLETIASEIKSKIEEITIDDIEEELPDTDSYLLRMDRFYTAIISSMNYIKDVASSPSSISECVSYLSSISKLSNPSINIQNIQKNISGEFPIGSLGFPDGPEDNSSSVAVAPTRFQVPLVSNSNPLIKNLDTVDEKILTIYKVNERGVRSPQALGYTLYVEDSELEIKKMELISKYKKSDMDNFSFEVSPFKYMKSKPIAPMISKIGRNIQNMQEIDSTNIRSVVGMFVLEVVNVPDLNFTIKYEDRVLKESSSVDSISRGPVCNSYYVTLNSGSEGIQDVTKIQLISSKIDINFDGSKRNVGAGPAKVVESTRLCASPEEWRTIDVTKKGGQSGAWSWATVPLNLNSEYLTLVEELNKYSKGGSVPGSPDASRATKLVVLDHKFVVDFNGSPLDISLLIQRGRTAAATTASESDKKVYLREEDLISQYEDKIIETKYNFNREISSTNLRSLQNMYPERDDINPEFVRKYVEKLEQRKKEIIQELVDKIKSFQIRLSANQCYSFFDYRDRANPASKTTYLSRATVYASICSPYQAFKIINNPEVRGVSLDDEEKERLKDFVISVFNLKTVVNRLRVTKPEWSKVTADDLLYKIYADTDEHLIETKNPMRVVELDKTLIAEANKILKDPSWFNSPGEYFRLSDESYLQYYGDDKARRPSVENISSEARKEKFNVMSGGEGSNIVARIKGELHRRIIGILSATASKDDEDGNDALDHMSKDSPKSKLNTYKRRGTNNRGEGAIRRHLFKGLEHFLDDSIFE
jgi:hypothetical protein